MSVEEEVYKIQKKMTKIVDGNVSIIIGKYRKTVLWIQKEM